MGNIKNQRKLIFFIMKNMKIVKKYVKNIKNMLPYKSVRNFTKYT